MKDETVDFFTGLFLGFWIAIFVLSLIFGLTAPTDEEMDKIKKYDALEQSYQDLSQKYDTLVIEEKLKELHIEWLNDQIVTMRGE